MNYAMTHSDRPEMPMAIDSSNKATIMVQRKVSDDDDLRVNVMLENNHEQTTTSNSEKQASPLPTEEKPKPLSPERLRVRAML